MANCSAKILTIFKYIFKKKKRNSSEIIYMETTKCNAQLDNIRNTLWTIL
jgi:hypothetical protein